MIISEDYFTNISYFMSPSIKGHNVKVLKDYSTELPVIYIDGELVFQVLTAGEHARGSKCNVAICDSQVDKKTIDEAISPLVRGSVDVIQIKNKDRLGE